MKITFVLNSIGRVGGVRAAFEHANHLQQRGHHVNVVYPAVNLTHLKRLSLGAFALWLVASTMRLAQNLIPGDGLQPFETTSSIIRVLALHPRFTKSLERSIPDADAVLATAWETAYAVNELSDTKGEKFYFVQSYEIWEVWNNEACWEEAKRRKKSNDTCALAMAAVTPKKRRVRETKELVDGSYRLPMRKITIAEWLQKLVESKFDQRTDGVVPNGVNSDTFFSEGERREASEHINVLMPYRPEKFKGFSDGLEAFARVKARHPDTRFAVFGRTPGTGSLRKLPHWIAFHPITSDAQLRALYSETHIFVVPSWIEGFGLPSMEAMACGCAVVATDAGGFTDCLANGENALLVPIQSPGALAQCVCRLIENDEERRRVAEKGYRFVQQFTWEDAAEKLEAILANRE